MTNFTKIHAALITKELFKEIRSLEKRREKAFKTELDNKGSYNGVRTQRHWQASATVDLCIRELEKKYKALAELDEQTNWSDNLHQGRYKFVEKDSEILEVYTERYKSVPAD